MELAPEFQKFELTVAGLLTFPILSLLVLADNGMEFKTLSWNLQLRAQSRIFTGFPIITCKVHHNP